MAEYYPPSPKHELQPVEPGGISVVGAGLAGLATAIKLKRRFPGSDVTVIEKRAAQSNTQIAGQRFRAGIAGQRLDSRQEIEYLLATRNSAVSTPQMQCFAETAVMELNYWQESSDFVEHRDRPDWFGPQWGLANRAGKGRGKSVIDWFKHTAKDEGVEFLQGEVQKLYLNNGHVEGLHIDSGEQQLSLSTDNYILAGGNMSGRLFLSTNKDISFSPQELAFNAGLSLVDSTTHMIHPFGNCDSDGRPRLGCFETDELAEAKVYLDGMSHNPQFDSYSTELLQKRQSHYHFPQIVQKFREHGSVTRLDFPNGDSKFARVSYHYGHLGVETTDGISVKGTDNLYAVGDASSISYWTEHNERFPGFALLKCLVDASLVGSGIKAPNFQDKRGVQITSAETQNPRSRANYDAIKIVNTNYVGEWLAAVSSDEKARIGRVWEESLANIANLYRGTDVETLLEISRAIAHAHEIIGSGNRSEPFALQAPVVSIP